MSDQFQFNNNRSRRSRGHGHIRSSSGGARVADERLNHQRLGPQDTTRDLGVGDGFLANRGGVNGDGSNVFGGPVDDRGGYHVDRVARGSYVAGSPSAVPDLHQASSTSNRLPREHRQVIGASPSQDNAGDRGGGGRFRQQNFRPQDTAGGHGRDDGFRDDRGGDGFRGSRGGANFDSNRRGGFHRGRDGLDRGRCRGSDHVDRSGLGLGRGRGGDRGGRGSYVGQAGSTSNQSPRQHHQVTDRMSALNITEESDSSSAHFSQAQLEASLSVGSTKFPARPLQPGTSGELCRVRTNHFLIQLDQSLHFIYHYDVTIEPETKTVIQNREVMKQIQSVLGDVLFAYDGQKSFYTISELPFESKELKTVPSLNEFRKEYTVKIKLVAKIDMHDILAPNLIQALDIVLRQTPGLNPNYTPVRRSFCSSAFGRSPLGGVLEAWKGFYQSVRPTQMGLSLNFDFSTAVFVQNLELVEFVKQILQIQSNKPFSNAQRDKLSKALKGLKVEVTHRRAKYNIYGLTTEPTEALKFPREDGKDKSVVQYFHEAYKRKLKYTSWPCLLVNKVEKIYMPIEVCKLVDGQKYNKGLDQNQTKNLVKLNSQKPELREQEILKMVCGNGYPNDSYAKEFGMNINEHPTMVQARILHAPHIRYGNQDFRPKEGKWNMMHKRLFGGGTVKFWTCINFAYDVKDDNARKFCSDLGIMCNTQGMRFEHEPVINPVRGSTQHAERDLKTLVDTMRRKNFPVEDLDLLIVILPDNNGSLYGQVKRICETNLGIITQCVLAKTVKSERIRTVLANFPSKINAKVGGTNMVFKYALPKIGDKPTIIFGADVTHPKAGEDSSPSIAAVVASIDWPNVTKYIPSYSAQVGRKEIIQELDSMVKEHLHTFVQLNKNKPERIIFYRDGVSEGQFAQVLEYELKAIKKAWSDEFKESPVPPITFVVVQKRHHSKLFPVNTNDSRVVDTSGNVMPGTLVDSKICHPSQFDFYLCSHAGIQGTSRPAHYHVLYDDNHFSADDIQTLSNNLCYMYARCTRSVSYPTPTYYAHLLAFRARFYMTDDPQLDGSSVPMHNAAENSVKQLPQLCERLKNRQIYC